MFHIAPRIAGNDTLQVTLSNASHKSNNFQFKLNKQILAPEMHSRGKLCAISSNLTRGDIFKILRSEYWLYDAFVCFCVFIFSIEIFMQGSVLSASNSIYIVNEWGVNGAIFRVHFLCIPFYMKNFMRSEEQMHQGLMEYIFFILWVINKSMAHHVCFVS